MRRPTACSEDMIPDAIEEVFPGTREAGKPVVADEDEDDGLDWEEETYEMLALAA